MNGMKKWVPLILIGCMGLLSGCGGGSGGSSDLASRYQGAVAPASITADNAEDLLLGALFSLNFGQQVSMVSVSASASPSLPILSLPQILQVPLQSIQPEVVLQSIGEAQSQTERIAGACGGEAIITWREMSGLSSKGVINYDQYCEDGITLDGLARVESSGQVHSLFYEDLTVKMPDWSISLNGKIRTSTSGTVSETLLDLVLSDSGNGKTYWYDRFRMVMDYLSSPSFSIQGRFFDHDLGYVNLRSESAVFSWNGMPDGKFLVEGGQGRARLETIPLDNYFLQVDENYDGIWEWTSEYRSFTTSLTTEALFSVPGEVSLQAVGGDGIFFSEPADRTFGLKKFSFIDKTIRDLAPCAFSPRNIVATGDFLVWVDEDGAYLRLKKTSITTGETSLLAGAHGAFGTLLADNSNIYWFVKESLDSSKPMILRRIPLDGGTPEVVATAQNGVVNLGQDDDFIYWSEWNSTYPATTRILCIGKTGGAPQVLKEGNFHIVPGLWAEQGRVVWGERPNIYTNEGRIVSISREGGTESILAEFSSYSLKNVLGVNDGHVYWAGTANPYSQAPEYRISRIPLSGGPESLAWLPSVLPFKAVFTSSGLLALSENAITLFPPAGGEGVSLRSGWYEVSDLTVVGETTYLLKSRFPQGIASIPLTGGDEDYLLMGWTGWQAVADDRYVYGIDSNFGVQRMPLDGGDGEVVFEGRLGFGRTYRMLDGKIIADGEKELFTIDPETGEKAFIAQADNGYFMVVRIDKDYLYYFQDVFTSGNQKTRALYRLGRGGGFPTLIADLEFTGSLAFNIIYDGKDRLYYFNRNTNFLESFNIDSGKKSQISYEFGSSFKFFQSGEHVYLVKNSKIFRLIDDRLEYFGSLPVAPSMIVSTSNGELLWADKSGVFRTRWQE